MRLDTLLLFPIMGIITYSLISFQSQHPTNLLFNYVECNEVRPFTYFLQKQKDQISQCGWSDFQYFAIMILFIGHAVCFLLNYLVSHKLWPLLIVIGEVSFGFSVYFYKKAYDAHAFCQKQIIPTLKEHNTIIICKDDAYYVIVGMLFLLSLLVIFYGVMYVIKDDHGIPLGDYNFSFAPDTKQEEKKQDDKKEDENKEKKD